MNTSSNAPSGCSADLSCEISGLENLGLKLPSVTDPNRQAKVVGIHAALTKTFADLLATAEGKYLVASFRTAYPKAAVTDEKALDLVLWQIR